MLSLTAAVLSVASSEVPITVYGKTLSATETTLVSRFGKASAPNCALHQPLEDDVEAEKSGFVMDDLNDGDKQRCAALLAPKSRLATTEKEGPMPLVVWFHGNPDDANACGWRTELEGPEANLATTLLRRGVALLCLEASMYAPPNPGKVAVWDMPYKMDEASGTPCNASDSRDVELLEKVLKRLPADKYDAKHTYFMGESVGASMAMYAATCLRERNTAAKMPRAVATLSSGLKTHGDGIEWPANLNGPDYGTMLGGECGKGCGYSPIVPEARPELKDLKLCIHDGSEDQLFGTNYTQAARALYKAHTEIVGAPAEIQIQEGRGHVELNTWASVFTCLDDGQKVVA